MIDSQKILILSLTILIIVSSCSKKKQFRTIGFAFKGDKITLSTDENHYVNVTVNGQPDEREICFFNKNANFNNIKNGSTLFIKIDSNNVTLLDTSILVTEKNQKPFISFIYPLAENHYIRKIFLGDESDSSFHIE